jgi:hypothetical protein
MANRGQEIESHTIHSDLSVIEAIMEPLTNAFLSVLCI